MAYFYAKTRSEQVACEMLDAWSGPHESSARGSQADDPKDAVNSAPPASQRRATGSSEKCSACSISSDEAEMASASSGNETGDSSSSSSSRSGAASMGVGVGQPFTLLRICPPAVWGPPLSAAQRGSESVCQMQQLAGGRMWPLAPPLGSGE